MKVIGITGPTGAGKTTALKVLSALGVAVADADEVYHALLTENEEMRAGLVSAFGENILDERGKIDRKKLSQAVYPDRLEELNAITHPYVVERMGQLLSLAEEEGKSIFAIDAIALMESGLSRWCDETVAVLAPKELRLRRIMVRDNIDEAYARRRVKTGRGTRRRNLKGGPRRCSGTCFWAPAETFPPMIEKFTIWWYSNHTITKEVTVWMKR